MHGAKIAIFGKGKWTFFAKVIVHPFRTALPLPAENRWRCNEKDQGVSLVFSRITKP